MTSVFLSCYDLPIIKQVAQVLGWIMSMLYKGLTFLSIDSYRIIICIVLFTIIMKLILLPMTIKQQKFTKVSAIMNPEIQAIQKKYQNKRGDQEAMMKMNQEMQAVYEKYGTSQSSGCMSLLVQMPILFALYGVVSQMPAFIPEIGDYFEKTGEYAYESIEDLEEIQKLADIKNVDTEKLDKFLATYESNDGKLLTTASTMSTSTEGIFREIFDAYDETEKFINEDVSKMTSEDWDKLIDECEKDKDKTLLESYKGKSETDWDNIVEKLESSEKSINEIKKDVDKDYKFFDLNLGDTPSNVGGIWAILIPVLAAATQFLSVKISNKVNGQSKTMEDNPMASSMKMMTITMPLMSAFLCYSVPAGLGVYWIISAVVTAIQSIFIGRYFKDMSVEDIVKSNIEKENKKRAKKGLEPKKITNLAQTNVKNIKSVEETKKKEETKPASSNKGGIAAKANLANKYNDKK